MNPVDGSGRGDIEMGLLRPQEGASTPADAAGDQEFENHLGHGAQDPADVPLPAPPVPAPASPNADQASLVPSSYGPQALDPVPSNHANHQLNNNTGNAPFNANHGTFVVRNNLGQHSLEHNYGTHMSSGNLGDEWIGHNKGDVNISESPGQHTIVNNDGGKVHISNLKPGGHVLITNQNGTVHQEFPKGTLQNWLHPDGVVHRTSKKPLELDQYGGNNFSNVTSNLQRKPVRYIPEYTSVAAGTALTTAVLINNASAIPASVNFSAEAFKNHFDGS